MKQKLLFLFFLFGVLATANSQTMAYPPPNIAECGIDVYNLTLQNPIILGDQNPTQFTVTYYYNQSDAMNQTNPIVNSLVLVLTQIQTIYAVVKNVQDNSIAITSFQVQQLNPQQMPPQPDVVACDSYTLPPLTFPNAGYFTAPSGGGSLIFPGTIITATTTIYIHVSNGSCSLNDAFIVTIIKSPLLVPSEIQNVFSCAAYTLPPLTVGTYDPSISSNLTITNTQIVNVFAQSNTTPNCFSSASFVVTIGSLQPRPDVTVCGMYTLPVMPDSNANYYTGPNGTGTILPPGSGITTTTTVYIHATSGTCPADDDFVVTVLNVPVITQQPVLLTNLCDTTSNVMLSVQATGENLSYTWYACGAYLGFSNTLISNSANFYCPSGYRCEVRNNSNNCVVHSETAIVVSGQTPIIVQQPISQTIDCADTNFTVSVQATGNALSYTWYLGTTLLTGTTNNTITLSTDNFSGGVFTCVVSNACGSITSAPAIINIGSCTSNTISGTIHLDYDANGCTPNDNGLSGIQVNCTNGPITRYAYTNNTGNYTFFNVPQGNNTITIPTIIPYNYDVVAPNTQTFSFLGTNETATADFCLTTTNPTTDAVLNFWWNNIARPGFPVYYNMYTYNNGNAPMSGTTTINFDNTKLDYVASNQTPISQTINSLTFDFTNVMPWQSLWCQLHFTVKTPPLANLGDILTFTGITTTTNTDANIANNSFTLQQTVVNSYDPNDISVQQGESIIQNQVANYLDYTVRFQNTGTADAINVRLTNELDTKLDWSTFKPVVSSHSYQVERDGNLLTFRFNNINLPGLSVNEPASHGFITYKVKPISTLTLGDIIHNNANIYFDFNAPIATNTVATALVNPLSVIENNTLDFSIYPNPASEKATIQFINILENEVSISVFDLQGKEILTEKGNIVNNQSTISITKLQSGMYFIKITMSDTTITRKLIVK